MFEIEKKVPVPPTDRPGRPSKYPFREMVPGDSFFVAGQTVREGASSAARVFAHRSGRKFRTRTVEGGVRIWRVE